MVRLLAEALIFVLVVFLIRPIVIDFTVKIKLKNSGKNKGFIKRKWCGIRNPFKKLVLIRKLADINW